MSIVFRYISKNLLQFFLGVLFVFVFVVFMGQMTRIFTRAATYGADMFWVAAVCAHLLPDILVLSIPMAFQIAILMTLTTMSRSGEIMALRSAGFSFWEISKPLFGAALILCALMFWLTGWVSPKGRHYVEQAVSDIASKITKVNIEPRTFINLGDWDIFAEDVDKRAGALQAVHLTRRNDESALSTKINAATGKVDITPLGIDLRLKSGQMQRLHAQDSRKIIAAEFGEYSVFIPLTQKAKSERVLKESEVPTPQIFAAIKSGGLNERDAADYKIEPGYRIAMSLAVIIYFLLSCPVAFVTDKKAGRAGAMIFSIVFILGYMGTLMLSRVVFKKAPYDALLYLGALLPVFTGLAAGAYLWRRKLSD